MTKDEKDGLNLTMLLFIDLSTKKEEILYVMYKVFRAKEKKDHWRNKEGAVIADGIADS